MVLRILGIVVGLLLIWAFFHALLSGVRLQFGLLIAPFMGIVFIAYGLGGQRWLAKIAPSLADKSARSNHAAEECFQTPYQYGETLNKIKSQQFRMRDILGDGWRLYRANFRNILLVILCVYIPINLIIAFVHVGHLVENKRLHLLVDNIPRILHTFIGIIATIAIAYLVEKSIHGQSITWRNSLRYGLSRWTSAIEATILAGLIVTGMTLLLIIPGIIWSMYYSFVTYIVALRNLDGRTALDYSKNLVQGQWWRVCGIQFIIFVLDVFLEIIVGLAIVVVIVKLTSHNQFSLILSNTLTIVPNTLVDIGGALFTVMRIVFFLNTDYLKRSSPTEPSLPPVVTA
jgi:hypothetical protein